MAEVWNNRYLTIGIVLWFALVFGPSPATDPSLLMGSALGHNKTPLLVMAYSGVFTAVVLPALTRVVRLEERLVPVMLCACCLQYLGAALVVGVAVNAAFASFAGGLLYGSGNILAIFCWGMLLVRNSEDAREGVFMAAILLAGLVLVLCRFLFADHVLASVLLFPMASLTCFMKAHADMPEAPVPVQGRSGEGRLRGFLPELLKLAFVFGLVGFIWQFFAQATSVGPFEKSLLFSLGFVLAAAALLLFVQYSPGMGVGSFVRWTFPIIAAGLLCASLGSAPLVATACTLFAGAHAALEAMMRIRVIGLARRCSPSHSAFALACGFAAISVGATVGEVLFSFVPSGLTAESQTVTNVIFTALVLVGALIPETLGGAPDTGRDDEVGAGAREPVDAERRVATLGERHALSTREREVLALLLEGRSGPVIREMLGLSKSTVDTHVRHIYQKIGVSSRQELIARAQEVA